MGNGFEAVFNIVIQFGAILAVVFYFRKEIFPAGIFSKKTEEREGEIKRVYQLWKKIIIAFIPSAVIGIFMDDILEKYLFNTASVSAALIAGAFLMLYAEKFRKQELTKNVSSISIKQALVIGFFQCLAMWPGMSRSASTIAGGLFTGLSGSLAAEFSFFLGIPTIMSASLYRLYKTGFAISAQQWVSLAAGTAVSFAVALFVVRFFMNYLRRKGLAPFALYRIVLGLVILIFFEF
jgi:undecaprenyl-diphosphatase